MCDKAVEEDLCLLEYVPDWFVRQEQIDLWGDADYGMIGWYEGYKKSKAKKASIKEELMPITWHLDHVMN